MPEHRDHEAHEKIAAVDATLNAHLRECATASERNDKAHSAIFTKLDQLHSSAWRRWWGVMIPLLGGMALILWKLLERQAEILWP